MSSLNKNDNQRLTETYVTSLENKITHLQEQLDWLKRQVFGQKSEKTSSIIPEQEDLFNEGEEEPALDHVEPKTETITYTRKVKSTPRQSFSETLPHVEGQTTDVPEAERACPDCQQTMEIIGQEVHKELEFIPAKFQVLVHKRLKRACINHPEAGVKVAPMIPRFCEKSNIGASVISQILADKYVNHLPFERQIQNFARYGYQLPKPTLQDLIKVPDVLTIALVKLIRQRLIAKDILYSDDTKIPVQDREKKGKNHQGYIWLYSDGDEGCVFDYQPGRGQIAPETFLKEFKGYLHVDGYSGYNSVVNRGVIPVNCWAHARRGFVNVYVTMKGKPLRPLQLINRMFLVERYLKEKVQARKARMEIRNRVTRLLIDKVYQWCRTHTAKALPSMNMGKAIGYMMNQREGLHNVLKDDRLSLSNNLSERALRTCVIGRKNWMHAGNHEAAERSCRIYSLVGTCKLLGVDPFTYLHWLLKNWTLDKNQPVEKLLPEAFKTLT